MNKAVGTYTERKCFEVYIQKFVRNCIHGVCKISYSSTQQLAVTVAFTGAGITQNFCSFRLPFHFTAPDFH